jgi:hypothetical protein
MRLLVSATEPVLSSGLAGVTVMTQALQVAAVEGQLRVRPDGKNVVNDRRDLQAVQAGAQRLLVEHLSPKRFPSRIVIRPPGLTGLRVPVRVTTVRLAPTCTVGAARTTGL